MESKKALTKQGIAAPRAEPMRPEGEDWRIRDRRLGAGWFPKTAEEIEAEEAQSVAKKKVFDVNDPKFRDQMGARDLMTEMAKQAGGATGTDREATMNRMASWDTTDTGHGRLSDSISGQYSRQQASAEGGGGHQTTEMSAADALAALDDL